MALLVKKLVNALIDIEPGLLRGRVQLDFEGVVRPLLSQLLNFTPPPEIVLAVHLQALGCGLRGRKLDACGHFGDVGARDPRDERGVGGQGFIGLLQLRHNLGLALGPIRARTSVPSAVPSSTVTFIPSGPTPSVVERSVPLKSMRATSRPPNSSRP